MPGISTGTAMDRIQSLKRLAKLVSYMLGRRPDEFGLVPDADGYVKTKELLKAICEEDGWRHVRESHIRDVLYSLPNPPVESGDKLVRARAREKLPGITPAESPPKLLYVGIRRRAYPVALERGILPGAGDQVILAAERALAERMGRRVDAAPVILTVQVEKSIDRGVTFCRAGECLHVADRIPPDCFSGPPLPKQKAEPVKEQQEESKGPDRSAGTFAVRLDREGRPRGGRSRARKQKNVSRKRDRERKRKQRRNSWA